MMGSTMATATACLLQGALRALRSAFGREPVLLREGGSIPIVADFKRWRAGKRK